MRVKYVRTAGAFSRRPLRKAALCLCAALLLSLCARADAPAISAKSAILVDAASGRVLFAQNVDTRRPVASTTKFMTCLLALEHASLDESVTVSARAAGTEGSSMYLKAGETLTMEALLYGLMLASGNDAAEAAAEHISGSRDAFVTLMNEKAAALGMKNTHFTDPSGLSEDAYSTASDMALLVRAALQNKELCKIISTKTISIGSRNLTNHNKLLWSTGGFFGGKTGYTKQAGRCLVSCAEQFGQRLVVVTLYDSNDWSDHAALHAYGFASYPRRTLCTAGTPVYFAAVEGGTAFTAALAPTETVLWPLAEDEEPKAVFSVPDTLRAPVTAGQEVGTVTYLLNGEEIASCHLAAVKDIPVLQPQHRSFLERLRDLFGD